MNISQLIEQLNRAKDQHGDIAVCVQDCEGNLSDVESTNPIYPWKSGLPLVEDKDSTPFCIELSIN